MRVRVNRRRKRSCSAKCWDCASKCCSASLLTAFNVVDSLCGLGIGGYGVYMGMNSFCPVWISISIAGVGFLLLCVALASWRGMSSSAGDSGRASVCLSFGSWLAMIAALMEITLGAALVADAARGGGFSACVPLVWLPAWLMNFGESLVASLLPIDELQEARLIDGRVLLTPELWRCGVRQVPLPRMCGHPPHPPPQEARPRAWGDARGLEERPRLPKVA